MTMTMNQRFCLLPLEVQFPPAGLFFLDDEFFKQEGRVGDIAHTVTFDEVRVLIPERQNTARLASHDGLAILDEGMELTDIKLRILARSLCEPL